MRNLRLSVFGALVIGLAGCGQEQAVETAEVIRPVEYFQVESAATLYTHSFPALAAPSDESDLSFRVGGQIVELNVVAGDEVKKGDVIARLDPTDYQVRLNEAQASYNLAQKNLERAESMLAMNLTSQLSYDQALADHDLKKANLDNARNNFRYTELVAPYSGQVSDIIAENGEVVSPTQAILSIHADNGIDVTYQLPESILSQVSPAKGRAYLPLVSFTSSPTMKDKEFRAQFKEIDRMPDPATRSYSVVLTMDKPEGILVFPGMTATVKLELDQIIDGLENFVQVPVEAVFSDPMKSAKADKYSVWKIDAETNTVHQQEVVVESITDNGIRITEGLEAGDTIVAAGVGALREGTEVREWIKERGI